MPGRSPNRAAGWSHRPRLGNLRGWSAGGPDAFWLPGVYVLRKEPDGWRVFENLRAPPRS